MVRDARLIRSMFEYNLVILARCILDTYHLLTWYWPQEKINLQLRKVLWEHYKVRGSEIMSWAGPVCDTARAGGQVSVPGRRYDPYLCVGHISWCPQPSYITHINHALDSSQERTQQRILIWAAPDTSLVSENELGDSTSPCYLVPGYLWGVSHPNTPELKDIKYTCGRLSHSYWISHPI